jgi:hypothetical protein
MAKPSNRNARSKPALPAPILLPHGPSRESMIAEAAYYRAERRGFAPGRELDDWLAAEREIDAPARPAA